MGGSFRGGTERAVGVVYTWFKRYSDFPVTALCGRTHPQAWWKRQYVREFFPTVHLGDPKLDALLSDAGLKVTRACD